ncbi:MAG: GNAT family N-acetyltransferase [Gemmatimonadetes bacterium]|nr:GNAT family N-acetyltransferase [Gemmatimonadota bacterium]
MPQPDPRIAIRELRDPKDPSLRGAYALLKQTFQRGERVDYREWVGSLQEKAGNLATDFAWHLFVAEQGGEVVGLASGTYLGNVNLGVVGYLAIVPTARASGSGTRLRTRLRQQFARDALRLAKRPLAGIIGEVSPTNPWLRRLDKRAEVLVLDFPYFQPRLYDDDEPSPFVLYYESMTGPRQRLPVGELRRILYTVWRRVYRIGRPLDRPAFRSMMRALANRRTVGRRKLLPAKRHDH